MDCTFPLFIINLCHEIYILNTIHFLFIQNKSYQSTKTLWNLCALPFMIFLFQHKKNKYDEQLWVNNPSPPLPPPIHNKHFKKQLKNIHLQVIFVLKSGVFQKFVGSETLAMSSEGLLEMFKGYLLQKCAPKFVHLHRQGVRTSISTSENCNIKLTWLWSEYLFTLYLLSYSVLLVSPHCNYFLLWFIKFVKKLGNQRKQSNN